jgi:hypothetical protein
MESSAWLPSRFVARLPYSRPSRAVRLARHPAGQIFPMYFVLEPNMKTFTVQIPDQLAGKAEQAGLLSSERVVQFLEQALRERDPFRGPSGFGMLKSDKKSIPVDFDVADVLAP